MTTTPVVAGVPLRSHIGSDRGTVNPLKRTVRLVPGKHW